MVYKAVSERITKHYILSTKLLAAKIMSKLKEMMPKNPKLNLKKSLSKYFIPPL